VISKLISLTGWIPYLTFLGLLLAQSAVSYQGTYCMHMSFLRALAVHVETHVRIFTSALFMVVCVWMLSLVAITGRVAR
jgi:hypothetical protein